MHRVAGIYSITNKINGKCYVGSSINLAIRKKNHVGELRGNRHGNEHLQRAWNKYGGDSFRFEVLAVLGTTEKILRIVENMYLYNLKPKYNMAKSATRSPMYGRKHTDETKAKVSRANKGKPGYWKGKKMSEEAKQKMRDNHADFSGKNHPQYGTKQSLETRMKIKKNRVNFRYGETNPLSKLKTVEVLEIRRLYKTGKFTLALLGRMFNVAYPTISKIVKRKTWRHL